MKKILKLLVCSLCVFIPSVSKAGLVLHSMQLTDANSLAGDPSSYFSVNVGGGSITAGESIGLYKFTGSPESAWVICISPAGVVDYNQHTYEMLSIGAPGATALNSPPWTQNGIALAGGIFGTYSQQVVSDNNIYEAWGLAAAVYSSLYGASVNFTQAGMDAGIEADFDHYMTGGSGVSHLLRPYPTTGYGSGQEFLTAVAAVPEPSTWIAGFLLLLCATFSIVRKKRLQKS